MYGEEQRENKVFYREEQKKKVLWKLKNKILREKEFLKYIYIDRTKSSLDTEAFHNTFPYFKTLQNSKLQYLQ